MILNLDAKNSLLISAIIVGTFMICEFIASSISGSLMLLADATHMLTDLCSLLISLISEKISLRSADQYRTFGYSRIKVIAAFANGIILICLAVAIIKEAIYEVIMQRNVAHLDISLMIITSTIGLLVNCLIFFILKRASSFNLNIKGALFHVLGDLLSSTAAIIGGVLIYYTKNTIFDAVISIILSINITMMTIGLLKESLHILLEGRPQHVKDECVTNSLIEHFQLVDVHHLHMWMLNENYVMCTMHIVLPSSAQITFLEKKQDIIIEVKAFLLKHHKIQHATIELELQNEKCSDTNIS
ncbi:cation diffusion facilitator family transporter [Candidatus Fokinia crypta]|uniref:Cation transporter n=1 Tax=Candidatus Fokinia crypta TaxID=1920990 RepID=A0ABZ0UQM8_9RICK|nr:cation diffusion facilitator family transporter [Candidatus Fokinia cryptica]WPX98014.1 Cation transporter [Candidatus Fokinia cryptica]